MKKVLLAFGVAVVLAGAAYAASCCFDGAPCCTGSLCCLTK